MNSEEKVKLPVDKNLRTSRAIGFQAFSQTKRKSANAQFFIVVSLDSVNLSAFNRLSSDLSKGSQHIFISTL